VQESAPSKTAEVVCFFRALEGRRPVGARILDDRYARLFLGRSLRAALVAAETAGPLAELPARFLPGVAAFVLARHRFIDDALAAALAKEGDERFAQLLILGAGYDTRAYRFAEALAGRPVFEVDFPSTGRRKEELVRKHARDLPGSVVRHVEVDFLRETFEAPLVRAGFQRGARTFVVWEGVSMYLTRDAVKQTFSLLRSLCAPGSEVCADFWFLLDRPDLRAAAHRLSASFLSLLGEPVLFGIHPEDAASFLGSVGFDVDDLGVPSELARRYVRDGRDVYPALYVVKARSRRA
jgi:methyltransferase (TIGR00027 family)